MYVEYKGDGLEGPGRIGWVSFRKNGATFFYQGRRLRKTPSGYKYNCYDIETHEHYWVSGPRKDGRDRLYAGRGVVEIDEDAREEYWISIRKLPDCKHLKKYRC